MNFRERALVSMGPMAGGYDDFAWLYSRHWGENSLQFLPALDKLVLDQLPTGSRILDLACGTGQLMHLLTSRGFRVTGLDSSAEMLRFARANAPGAELVLAEARSFELPDTYEAVVSVYDSLNHIMSLPELGQVFVRVRAALAPSGRFVFDLNTEEGYTTRWGGSFGIAEDDHAAVARGSYDAETKIARFEAAMFRPKDDLWSRAAVVLLQRCYAEAEVREALLGAGFGDVETRTAETFGISQPGRVFFAATAR
jgi:SAM-dependent methyltransferase